MTSNNKSGWKSWSKLTKTETDTPFFEKLWDASDTYGNQYEPNVEAGLAKFKNRIRAEAKVVPMKSSFRWMRIAAAVIILFGVGIIVQNFLNTEPNLQIVETSIGYTKEVKLTDGTVVHLNENSELTFPKEFDSEKRMVQLKGEAFFEVAKNPNQPFFVESDNGIIEVLGTAFNVRSIDSETFEEVTVDHGKVAFAAKNNQESAQLTKSMRAILDKETGVIRVMEDEKLNALAWKTKKLSFRGERLNSIFDFLERNIDVDFHVSNKSILDCNYTVSFKILEINEALKALELASNNELRFEKIKNGNYKVVGNTCK